MKDNNQNNFLLAAEKIGYQIINEAIWFENKCTWLGYFNNPIDFRKQEYVYGSIPANFYDGTCGIAYFLALLFRYTNNIDFQKHAIGAINHAIYSINKSEISKDFGAFYTGAGGIAKIAYICSLIFNDIRLKSASIELVNQIIQTGNENIAGDIINGSPGIVPFLIYVEKNESVVGLKEYIINIESHILRTATQEQNEMFSWDSSGKKSKNLNGYAHGCSGFVHTLMELYSYNNNSLLLKYIQGGLSYERMNFNPNKCNWPDYRIFERDSDGNPTYMNAWCHGAAGIGLTRIRAFELLNKDELCLSDLLNAINKVKADVEIADKSTNVYSLCHGIIGNVELLIESSILFKEPAYFEIAKEVGEYGISNILDLYLPFKTGLQGGCYTPTFMNGLSGVGYFYLRLASGGELPSILLQRSDDLKFYK